MMRKYEPESDPDPDPNFFLRGMSLGILYAFETADTFAMVFQQYKCIHY